MEKKGLYTFGYGPIFYSFPLLIFKRREMEVIEALL
jgi:hypothetical protein